MKTTSFVTGKESLMKLVDMWTNTDPFDDEFHTLKIEIHVVETDVFLTYHHESDEDQRIK